MTTPRPRDAMRAFLAIALLASFNGALFWLMTRSVPAANRDLVNFMLGQLSILTTGGIGYYLNTSKSSADKNALIGASPQLPDTAPDSEPLPPATARDLPRPQFGEPR